MAIARALVNDPAVLLADEPTGAWTPRPAKRSASCCWTYTAGQTLVLVTHSPDLAARYANRRWN